MCDPVVNDPEADAISFSHLSDVEGVGRRFGRRNPVLVSYPSDRAEREGLASRTAMAFRAQQADDLVVMVVDCQLSDARDEGLGITDRLGPVRRQPEFQGFRCAALPADVQSDDLRLRSLRHGDVAHQQAQDPLAVPRRRGRRAQSRGKFCRRAARICRFCSAVTARMVLSFEGRQLGFEFLQALHGVVPALLRASPR